MAATTASPPAQASINKLGGDMSKTEWSAFAATMARYSQIQLGDSAVASMLKHTDAIWPYSRATSVLDNGCGSGVVMAQLLQRHARVLPRDCELKCGDFSEGMAEMVAGRKGNEYAGAEEGEAWGRVRAEVIDACDMSGVEDGSLSHVLANFVYFLVSDSQKALRESWRCLREGGACAASSWQGSQWLEIMSAFEHVRPDLEPFPELPQEWTTEAGVKGEFKKAGFREVVTELVKVELAVESHDSFVEFMKLNPLVKPKLEQMGPAEVEEVSVIMLRKLKEMCPEAPAKLNGWAVVAAGKK
ncbi:hypothetical protein MBLNU230_g7194t1 [Neophaeotheca triangularis]